MFKRVVLLAVVVCSMHALAEVRAKSFESSIMLDTDGAAVVNETITLAQPASDFVRAIWRRTPGHEQTQMIVRVVNVQDEQGNTVKWHTWHSGRRLKLQVDARTAVVRLTYLIPNAVRFAGDHDELIWPATDPDFAVDRAEVRVMLPAAADGQFSAQAFSTAAYRAGPVALWSSTGALPIDIQGTTVRTAAPGPMRPGAVVTIDVFVQKGVLAPPMPLTRAWWYVATNRIVLLPFVALVVMLVIRRIWHVPDRQVITRYEPPPGLAPAEIGTLADDQVDPRDVAATIADLAVRGFIRFDAIATNPDEEHADPDFKITLLKPQEDWALLAPFEQRMLFHTFYGGHWTQLSSLRLRFPSMVPWFTDDVMQSLRAKGLYAPLRGSPWFMCKLGFAAVASLLLAAQVTGIATLFDSPWGALTSLALSAAVILGLSNKVSGKTRRGQRVWAEIRGFQEFLDRVDADRLERLTPDLYEKYLPYAMALGVERGWTAAFDGIAVPVPEWFGADGGITDPSRFHDTLHAFLEHTLHEIRNARGPRVKLNARAAKAN